MAFPSAAQAEDCSLNSFPVKFHRCPCAIDFQGAICSDGVRTDENPVLPCRKAAENSRLECFGASEAQIRLESRKRIGRLRGTRLYRLANFIPQVAITRRGGHRPRVEGLPSRKLPSNLAAQSFELRGILVEAGRHSRKMVHHGQRAKIHIR